MYRVEGELQFLKEPVAFRYRPVFTAIEFFTHPKEIGSGPARLDAILEDARLEVCNASVYKLGIVTHRGFKYGSAAAGAWAGALRANAKTHVVPAHYPSRPFARTHGSLDTFQVRTKRPHIPDEAAPGADVEVGGWIIDGNSEPVRAAWVDVAGVSFPVDLNRERADVAQAHAMTDPSGKRVGFSAILRLPADLAAGVHEARVVGASKSGSGVYGSGIRKVRIAFPPTEAGSVSGAAATRDGTIRVGDTQTVPYTLGRGRQTIRDESSLRLIGRIDGAERVQVIATPLVGRPTAWQFPVDAAGGFDAVLWTAGVQQGLHRLSIASGDATSLDPIFWCEIALAGPHRLPPLHLGTLRTAPDAGVLHFGDAAPRTTPIPDDRLIAGTPIGVAGWCIDPVAGMPVLAVYVEVDNQRPVPLSAHLPDPRRFGHAAELPCGFGGIIDTTRLAPGSHRVRLLGAAVSGSGWYVIDDREIQLADHRLAKLADEVRS